VFGAWGAGTGASVKHSPEACEPDTLFLEVDNSCFDPALKAHVCGTHTSHGGSTQLNNPLFVPPRPACRFVKLACECVLRHLPADSSEAQQQWPVALALAAAEAVGHARQHLER
jgi:hypothetical protein